MRPIRIMVTLCATALLGAACGGGDGTSSTAAGRAGQSSAAATPADNGVADLGADAILAKAKAALKGAGAVRIKGTGGSGTDRFALDVRYSGSDAEGTFSSDGQPIELRRVGSTVYLKASKEFWTKSGNAAAGELLAGKWLKTPLTDQRFAGLAEFTDLSKTADGLLDPDGTVSKGTRKTVAGIPAIGLRSGKEDDGQLYVATTGQPYPLQIMSTDAKDPGQVDFTDFGKKTPVAAPAAEEVVDVTKLGG